MMNDEALEIENSASEAAPSESVAESEEVSVDMPLADAEDEISDIEAQKDAPCVDEEDSRDAESDDERVALKAELERLRTELASLSGKKGAFISEIKEFSEIFGAAALSEIPESVWESASDGVPLAAAYALYEKKTARQKELADAVNKKNASMSAGAVKSVTESGFFSPSEVRAMTPKEVKKNYNLIIESMKKWN